MTVVHHATLIRADSVCLHKLTEIQPNTEVDDFYNVRFGIDDARDLVRKAHNRPVETEIQTLVVRTEFITLEAQNALLKVLEEPPQSTNLVFIVPSGFTILPTLASRFNEVLLDKSSTDTDLSEIFSKFLLQSYKDRLASIDQSAKKKDVEWQLAVKQGLVQYLRQKSETIDSLQSLEYVARTLLTRGASNKMLLEHVALTLPVRS